MLGFKRFGLLFSPAVLEKEPIDGTLFMVKDFILSKRADSKGCAGKDGLKATGLTMEELSDQL